MRVVALQSDQLSVSLDPAQLDFETTDDLPPAEAGFGQARAIEALAFGTEIAAPGFNLFVMGPEGTGRKSAVLRILRDLAQKRPTPPDWVYVNNFDDHRFPNAMSLPAGRGLKLTAAMDAFVQDVGETVPALFENEENQNRLRAIEEEFRQKPEEAFEALRKKAEGKDIALVRTPMGFGFAPLAKGEIIQPEEFERLSSVKKKRIQADTTALQEELQAIIKRMPNWDRERRKAIHALQSEITGLGVGACLDPVIAEFKDLPEVVDYLEAVRLDLVEKFHAIKTAESRVAQGHQGDGLDTALEAAGGFDRYKVNSIVSHGEGADAPVVTEDNPTAFNLIGRSEHLSRYGALITDFSLIKAGALHRANGGYLVVDARKLLLQPFAWEALKRALKAAAVTIESPAQEFGLIATVSLEPEPIPLRTKVVLLGGRMLFYLLSELDPEFPDLFKVVADFETDVNRSATADRSFLQGMADLVREKGLLPFDAGAVAQIHTRMVRLAGDRTKLSIHMRSLCDLLHEAEYYAKQEGGACVNAKHVVQAVDAQRHRLDRIREKDIELIDRDIILIKTEGSAVGQVNGLSVLQLGGFAFGRPSRITARVRLGSGKLIDIEREVKLGGPLHSKGVLILSGFLAGRYAVDDPLSLSATLVFEQSYGGVDGDSASSAELYALLSALAEVPLRQDLAVTGSINQFGEIQAIGGVNEKIEGFFDTCCKRGLTGSQGVLIPAANREHLILREDVVEAATAGQFHVYAVASIDEGIALLTGLPAGQRGPDGGYTEESINALVEARLVGFAAARHAFVRANGSPEQGEEGG